MGTFYITFVKNLFYAIITKGVLKTGIDILIGKTETLFHEDIGVKSSFLTDLFVFLKSKMQAEG